MDAPLVLQLVLAPAGAALPAWPVSCRYESLDGSGSRLVLRELAGGTDVRAAAAEAPAGSTRNVYRRILSAAAGDGEPFLTGRPLSVVMLDMVAAREQAMNAWYDDSHVPNLLRVPGYRNAARYRLVDPRERPHAMRPEYLALYELESERAAPFIGPDQARMSREALEELAVFERDWSAATRDLYWGLFRSA